MQQLLKHNRLQLAPAGGLRAPHAVHRPLVQLGAQVLRKAVDAEDVAAVGQAHAARAEVLVKADRAPAARQPADWRSPPHNNMEGPTP